MRTKSHLDLLYTCTLLLKLSAESMNVAVPASKQDLIIYNTCIHAVLGFCSYVTYILYSVIN